MPWPVKYGSAPAVWRALDGPMLRLAARPLLHPLLELVVSSALPVRSLRQLIGKVDWVHFVGTGRDYIGFALVRFARRMGVRFTVWPAVHPREWGDDVLDVRLYQKADAVMCQTSYEQRHLAELGVPESKLLPCGLPPMCLADGNSGSIRRELDLGNRPCVLFLGRRDEGKGYFALLRAWPIVLQALPDACLLLGGPGDPHQGELDKLPPGSFRDLGLASERTKADALAACNVFCLPSSHESFGIAYVEAWSYRKPVICGTAPACRELIEDGKSGLWADQDPANLSEKIVRLSQDSNAAKVMGEYGHSLQRRRLSWEVVANAHLQAAGLQPKL
jgi:glycosyltransferase involved in cell wall biosynthesis